MIDIDPALRSTLGFHIGYEKDSMHAKLAGTLRQIGNFGEGMVPEPRPTQPCRIIGRQTGLTVTGKQNNTKCRSVKT